MRKKTTPQAEPPADPAERLQELAEDFVRLEARAEELRQAAHDANEAEQSLRRARLNGEQVPTSKLDEAIDARDEAEAERTACETLLTEKREGMQAAAREAAGMRADEAKREAARIRAHETALVREMTEHVAALAATANRMGFHINHPCLSRERQGHAFIGRVVSALQYYTVKILNVGDLEAALAKAAPNGPLESLLDTPDAERDRAEATARDWFASGAERLVNEALEKAGRGLVHENH